MADINQDDIDKLLQEGLGGGDGSVPAAPLPLEESGVASQDDIDALFSFVGNDADAPASALEPPAASAAEPAPPAAGVDDAASPPEDDKPVGNDDIDALFAMVGEATAEPPSVSDGAPTPESGADLSVSAELDELLSSITGDIPGDEAAGSPSAGDTVAGEPLEAEAAAAGDAGRSEAIKPDEDIDLDELLKQVNEAAPPPPPVSFKAKAGKLEETAALEAPAPPIPPPPAPPLAPPPAPPPAPLSAYGPESAAPPGGDRREYGILRGAGEVESAANQISVLISSMSEKAQGYMRAWIAADSEAKELRIRALAEERRRSSLESEKAALAGELDSLRLKLGEAEGARIAGEESRRILETSFQSKTRELESRISLLGSESEALKDELSRVRNQATGIDLESRRAKFESERLRNEVESERMERLRLQRALENREKELQALQAQSSGQASSLFIDELHRLVRRLETELEARTSSAHEALKQVDRLEAPEAMVPVVANIRAALLRAMGSAEDSEDALRSLGREASGVRGAAALAPGKSDVVSFETALSTYNLASSIEAAGVLLREAKATPGLLMRKIYQCPALRRPETADHLPDLARLLDGLRTVQEAGDRARGSESGESEVFYVHLFDFLHNLVRLKLINRLSGDVWRIFLDLRGRFSFVTSDRQWAEYRDGALGGKDAKV